MGIETQIQLGQKMRKFQRSRGRRRRRRKKRKRKRNRSGEREIA